MAAGHETDQERRERLVVLYARVSSTTKQTEAAGDLRRQIDALKQYCPDYDDRVVQDIIGSAFNFFKCKGLETVLDLVETGNVAKVVVTYRDRLARFGVDLLERTFAKCRTTLDVVSCESNRGDSDRVRVELTAEDLLAVCNYFVAKNNGRRAAAAQCRGRREGRTQSASKRRRTQEGIQEGRKSSGHNKDPATSEDTARS